MKPARLISSLLGVILLVFVAALLIGQVLGQPVLLGFVETGSMAPTLQPGDGFIAIPTPFAGSIEPGDVVVFDAEVLHGGGLVTHRVVGETTEGFITKGDANPVTDQESTDREPPVPREKIVAEVWQIGGSVVVVPGIGMLVIAIRELLSGAQLQLANLLGTRQFLGTQGLAYLLFIIGIIAYAVNALLEGRSPTRIRDTSRNRGSFPAIYVNLILTVLLVLVVTAGMVIPGGPQEFEVISSDNDAPGSRIIQKGTVENSTYRVPSNGILPVVVFLEPSSTGIDVSPRELYVPSQRTVNATITLEAPPETGFYRRYLIEHRYLAILPQPTIKALYLVHPWLPIVVIDVLLGVSFFTIGSALIGFGRVRVSSRSKRLPLTTRLRRWLR